MPFFIKNLTTLSLLQAAMDPTTDPPASLDVRDAADDKKQHHTVRDDVYIDPKEEKALLRKLDRWIVPPVMLLYLFRLVTGPKKREEYQIESLSVNSVSNIQTNPQLSRQVGIPDPTPTQARTNNTMKESTLATPDSTAWRTTWASATTSSRSPSRCCS